MTARDGESEFGTEAMNSLLHDFYVDDFIKSYPLTEVAKSSVKAVTGLCKSGGFNLRNFISNAPECLSELPSPNVKSDLATYDLPYHFCFLKY